MYPMFRTLKLVALSSLLAAAVLATGCATTAKTENGSPLTEKLSKYNKIDVRVKTGIGEAKESLNTIETQIANKLEPRFKTVRLVEGEKEEGTVVLNLDLVDYKRHSNISRFFLGTLPGPDRIIVHATLVDLTTNKTIGTFTGTGEANLGGIVVGDAGIYRASSELGKEINKYLSKQD